MAQPLTATYRLGLHIVVQGLLHKQRFYARASPSILSADGFFLWERDDIADIEPHTAAQVWWNAVRGNFNDTVAAPSWLLEQRTGTSWNPVAGGAVTGAGTDTGDIQIATQFTISMRTTDFNRIRMVILESNSFELGIKTVGSAGMAIEWSTLASRLDGSAGLAGQLWNWVRSLNNIALAESGPIVSGTYDLNDAVRRARGVQ
jgi:hypothetical protein